MSKVGPEHRSFLPIETEDLRRLLAIAERDRRLLFERHPEQQLVYADAVLCVTLCQGAALHYVNGTSGINDFDVYTFFRKHPYCRFPNDRRHTYYDFGDPKFGRSEDKPHFVGRRVDCFMRDVLLEAGDDYVSSVRRYLQKARQRTARELAQRAVVLLDPDMGSVLWPASAQ